jgi:hypothetical protein
MSYITASSPHAVGVTWDDVLGTAKNLGGGALEFYNQAQKSKGAEEAYKEMMAKFGPQKSTLPSWVVPAAVAGGLGLVLILVVATRR